MEFGIQGIVKCTDKAIIFESVGIYLDPNKFKGQVIKDHTIESKFFFHLCFPYYYHKQSNSISIECSFVCLLVVRYNGK